MNNKFKPNQSFELVSEAMQVILAQDNPLEALKAVVCANLDTSHLGFAAELIEAFPNQINPIRSDTVDQGASSEPPCQQDFWLLVMRGDVEPEMEGPFESDALRLNAARLYRQEQSDDDGVYRVTVPKGSDISIDPFSGNEMGPIWSDPVVDYVIAELEAGRCPIERFNIPQAKWFTVTFEGDEVIFNDKILMEVETRLCTELVTVIKLTTTVLVTEAIAKLTFEQTDWKAQVSKGKTKNAFEPWVAEQVQRLTKARDVLP